ncbi:conserved hypothetical protein [Theileria orientalis strain Shintoku]|uniref:Uncharacterized protein n=1 Tax=Theileria orientalis strain Shintoku TaxID=869250 RepID=J4DAJ9_THEOR|nr:conserved hypothetical protein [Theileria orientalis strain Shintoku]BAM42035.1 conserved hypothetical protein [Theileria orientalis strain Shintoku]|eukprot:XP_009692336.1 conserved hypothetical protein [Theileria orientalis strain Shintoku]
MNSFINNQPFKKSKYRDFKRYLNVKKTVDSLMTKVKKFHSKGVEIATKKAADSKPSNYIKVTNDDRKKSILCVVGILIGYGILYTFYSKWKRENEMKRVQQSIEQYERDKLEYIETGHTR